MKGKRAIVEYASAVRAANAAVTGIQASLLHGDCLNLLARLPSNSIDLVVTSPPYCMGMEYERSTTVEEFVEAHRKILPEIIRVTKKGGSICWQVGYHVSNKVSYPLDYAVHSIMESNKAVSLRNRIIWSFGHGLHSSLRFSGRHETILWYTKGDNYFFDLDSVRIRQKYPGKRHYKGPSRGEFSGNPLGKNPSDVWDIPNVKGNHIEKVGHPCQFPVGLVQRLVRSLCPIDGLLLDPFMGAASSGVAAIIEGRRFVGAELNKKYFALAAERVRNAAKGQIQYRPVERPIFEPDTKSEVARIPAHFFKIAAE